MPMTRLQITPQREQGRTKRKKRQRAPSVTPIGRGEVNARLQIRKALSDGRRRRRRRRRSIAVARCATRVPVVRLVRFW